MVQYKWVALSNTTIGMLMASIDATIVLIAMPAIFARAITRQKLCLQRKRRRGKSCVYKEKEVYENK